MLQISFEILRFIIQIQECESSEIQVNKNYHTPKTLFTIFNAVNPTVCEHPGVSKLCEGFLGFFVNKISDIRLGISPPAFRFHRFPLFVLLSSAS